MSKSNSAKQKARARRIKALKKLERAMTQPSITKTQFTKMEDEVKILKERIEADYEV